VGNFPAPSGFRRHSKERPGRGLVAPFNDLATVESILREHGDEIAAITSSRSSACSRRSGLPCRPAPAHREYGILLIFDEDVTGFRFAYGGAQKYYGVVPDICTLGKTIGAAFRSPPSRAAPTSWRISTRRPWPPTIPDAVGTLSGNRSPPSPAQDTRDPQAPGCLRDDLRDRTRLMEGFDKILQAAGVKAARVGDAPMFDLVSDERPSTTIARPIGDQDAMKRSTACCASAAILKGDSKYTSRSPIRRRTCASRSILRVGHAASCAPRA